MQKARNFRFLAGLGITSTVALSVLVVPAHAAEGEIRSADAAEKVPNSYVVKLKDTPASVSATEATANAVAARNGGGVDRVFGSALRGFTVKLSERQAKRLAADPAVEYVEQDQVFRADTTQTNPPSWGLDRIDQASL